MKLLSALLYLGAVVLTNVTSNHFGMVGVGFGLLVPAGVFLAGLTFGLRDVLQEYGGVELTVLLIIVGSALSVYVSPELAIASGVAFLCAELLDLSVYTPLRNKNWTVALVLSNLVGSIADAILFLAIAPFPLTLSGVIGLTLGKMYMVIPVAPIIYFARKKRNA